MPTLYLIDGYAQFFRNYHAIRTPMTSPVTKEPTNMTFGFVGLLLKLLRGEGKMGGPPDYLALALDVSGDRGTFRSQLLPEYKATRPPAPVDLRPQVDRCLNTLRDLGVPIYGAEGYEADDVIASIVTKLRRENPDLNIRILSNDKDLKQLLDSPSTQASEAGFQPASTSSPLSGSVELYDAYKDQPYGVHELETETGLKPHQVIDMLSLMGDAVDNVPGVPGVGDKTAAALMKEYGTLENLLARAAEIKGKRGENIRAAAGSLPLSRELITLKRDVTPDEGEFDLGASSVAGLHLDRLMPILKELGFNRYQDELRTILGETPVMPDAAAGHRRESAGDSQGQSASAPSSTTRPRKPADDGGFGGLFDAVAAADATSTSSGSSGNSAQIMQGEYRCVTTKEHLADLVAALKKAKTVAVDTETTALAFLDADLCGVSLAVEPGSAWYVPVRSPEPAKHLDEKTVLAAIKPTLEDSAVAKVGHNLKYDLLVLRRAGVRLRGIAGAGGGDTMVASYLIDSSRSSHGLESLALALLGATKSSISELIGSGKVQRSFATVPIDQATPYAARDADLALQLAHTMLPQIRTLGMTDLFSTLEMPLVEVLAELEFNGVLVDPAELDRQRDRLNGRIKELKDQIDDRAMESVGRTFDPDSPKQLSAALFNKPNDAEPGLGIKPVRKTKTGYSTDAEVLEKLAQDVTLPTPIPALILEYRQLTKLVSTYLVALKDAIHPSTKRVHTSFNQTVAATGRLASSDPNLQNIPIRTEIGREIRKAFVAPPGQVLITADYSQIELRLLAHLSRDPNLIEAFRTGQDIHQQVAAQIHGVALDQVTKDQRNGAKMVNFGIVYGITPYGLARRLGVDDNKAAEIIDGYKRRFSGITTFLQECIDQAKRFGYVETIMKRRRPILDIESTTPAHRAFAERTAINSVVQGSAADLIKIAMVDLHGIIAGKRGAPRDQAALQNVRMLLQIHDELVFECPEGSADRALSVIVDRMERAMDLSVPLKVDAHAGRNWFEGK